MNKRTLATLMVTLTTLLGSLLVATPAEAGPRMQKRIVCQSYTYMGKNVAGCAEFRWRSRKNRVVPRTVDVWHSPESKGYSLVRVSSHKKSWGRGTLYMQTHRRYVIDVGRLKKGRGIIFCGKPDFKRGTHTWMYGHNPVWAVPIHRVCIRSGPMW